MSFTDRIKRKKFSVVVKLKYVAGQYISIWKF